MTLPEILLSLAHSLSHTHTPVLLSCVYLSCYCEEGRFLLNQDIADVFFHTLTHMFIHIFSRCCEVYAVPVYETLLTAFTLNNDHKVQSNLI